MSEHLSAYNNVYWSVILIRIIRIIWSLSVVQFIDAVGRPFCFDSQEIHSNRVGRLGHSNKIVSFQHYSK